MNYTMRNDHLMIFTTTNMEQLQIFENWNKSGILYTEDVFDDEDNFRRIEHFANVINKLIDYVITKFPFQ